MHKFLLLLILMMPYFIAAVSIEETPVCVIPTPDSILEHKEDYKPWFIAGRSRYATCTGVAWFHEKYIAVLNLYGRMLRVYKFNTVNHTASLVQTMEYSTKDLDEYPENLTVSSDGKTLVVCCTRGIVNFHAIDEQTHKINQVPYYVLKAKELVHNVRFSSDGRYFAYVTFDEQESLVIFRLHDQHGRFSPTKTYQEHNLCSPMKLKGILFFKGANPFVAVFCATGATNMAGLSQGKLTIRTFDTLNGTLGETFVNTNAASSEDMALVASNQLILSNQGDDSLSFYQFDPETGTLSNLTVKHSEYLTFPHGLGLSPDENYLAVTNYGNDTCVIYRIKRD